MGECNEMGDGSDEDDTISKRLDKAEGSSTGDDTGMLGSARCESRCLLAASSLARRRLLSLPSTLPPRHFVLGQGRGSRARAGALCP